MIRKIIELLIAEEHYNKSELIEIAKGKNQIPTSLKKGFTQIKRILKWQKI
jgi:hypothetical protein